MREDGRAVAFDMFIEPYAEPGLGHDRSERGFADLKRIAPQSCPLSSIRSKALEEYPVVDAVVPNEIERGHAVVIASDSFAIDDA